MRNTKVIIFSIIFVLCMSTTAVAAESTYTDVKITSWAYPAVKAMSDKEILKGYPDGSFKSANTLTYGEFLKMIVLSTGETDPGNAFDADGNALIDEATGQKMNWAQKYYDAALNKGYFTTYQIHSSKLNNDIPRGDMAILVSAVLGDVKLENYDELKDGITDINLQTKNEYDIIKSYGAGILTGYENGAFKPNNTLNRAEAATVIYRLVDESKRAVPKSGVKDIPSVSTGAVTAGGVDARGIPLEGNVADVVSNYDSYTFENGTIDEYLREAKTYIIDTDPSPYKLSLKENRGTKWMDSTGLELVYLMKDGKIVEYVAGNRFYKTDISEVDYIVSLRSTLYEMILIPNPFKNNK